METFEKVAVIAILLFGVGTVLFFLPLSPPSEGRPQFNVLDFQVMGNSVSMYVNNTGSSDAHNVRIEVHGYSEGEWVHLNCPDTSGPSVLKVGQLEKVVLICGDLALPVHGEYKIVIGCDEGVTQEIGLG